MIRNCGWFELELYTPTELIQTTEIDAIINRNTCTDVVIDKETLVNAPICPKHENECTIPICIEKDLTLCNVTDITIDLGDLDSIMEGANNGYK